ncbi:tRNA pseudouridine(55) synthase TruB [Streptomyces sp. SID7805]|nr:tRNA pseudouridine(55) synthase TruB [Streptomyces sp. SID7805]
MEASGAKHAAPDGLVIVDKPAGFTSHDVVAKMRGMARTRRVGHAGTLDPMATGVLVLGIERATKLLGHLALTEKEYVGTIRLGQTTVTDDAEGEITASKAAHGIAREDIDAGIAGLSGAIMQIPSKVSAIKIDGKRSYSRVRDGEDVEIPARPVTVSSFVLHSAHETEAADGTPVTDLLVSVECSSGTYIRALARDLGEGLGVGGHLTALRRTRVGPYKLDRARTLEQLQAAVNGGEGAEGTGLPVMPIGDAAAAAFVRWDVTQAQARLLANGVRIAMPLFDGTDGSDDAEGAGTGGRVGGPVAVFGPDGTFLALVENQGGKAKSLAVFV